MKLYHISYICLLYLIGYNCFAQETRTKIAIIDTGIKNNVPTHYLCESGHKDLTGYGLEDIHGHGTNIAGIIMNKIDTNKYCLLIIKWFHHEYHQLKSPSDVTARAIRIALQNKVSYINLSMHGEDPNNKEKLALKTALDNDIIITVAAGNQNVDLNKKCNIYPACYESHPNLYVVANYKNGKKQSSSNYNGPVTDKENGVDVEGFGIKMTGTSQACAVKMNKLLRGI